MFRASSLRYQTANFSNAGRTIPIILEINKDGSRHVSKHTWHALLQTGSDALRLRPSEAGPYVDTLDLRSCSEDQYMTNESNLYAGWTKGKQLIDRTQGIAWLCWPVTNARLTNPSISCTQDAPVELTTRRH